MTQPRGAERPPMPETEPLPGLTWGLKRSFIRYISMLPDGGHSVSGSASLTYSSFFNFEPAADSTYDPITGRGALKFVGEVRLTGHHNLLFVMIADPWIEFRDGEATLSVADTRYWPDRRRRIPLAILQAETLSRSIHGVCGEARTFLTGEGVEVFNGQYGDGEELDPVFILGSTPPATMD
ncbi:HtaA domain-containing protein [Cryobacterium sp. N19]|uniref:HtaA domain-containing protein n=1 Tax=Cryobacterium sp. N19 TaxID=2048288 RepID=UPI000CE2BD99|nr:HtaA domain-containing protein [Cryobacterium sp. N19]